MSQRCYPWDSQFLDTLDYQWHEVAIPFWKDIDARARDADVKVCIEMHPHNIVFNPGTMERLATEINATHVGAEMDPTLNRWPANSSWDFVAVGRGHDQEFWSRFLQALHAVDPGMAVNIEHEDAEFGQIEGLRLAAENLNAAAAKAGL